MLSRRKSSFYSTNLSSGDGRKDLVVPRIFYCSHQRIEGVICWDFPVFEIASLFGGNERYSDFRLHDELSRVGSRVE